MIDLSAEIQMIWDHDEALQLGALTELSRSVRHVSDDRIIQADVETLRKMGCFFVPDNYYLVGILGEYITQYKYGLYHSEFCTLAERLAIPLRVQNGAVVGFVGYSNTGTDWDSYNSDEGEEETSSGPGIVIPYLYPPKHVFEKGRFIFCEPIWYAKAIRDGYICIVDGLFDAIRLNQNGINACSLCGSKLTPWHILYLSFIRNKIVLHDNDAAGVRLAEECKRKMQHCSSFQFDTTKDIDDFLKDPKRLELFLTRFEKLRETDFIVQDNLFVSPRNATRLLQPLSPEVKEPELADETRIWDQSQDKQILESGAAVLEKLKKKGQAVGYIRSAQTSISEVLKQRLEDQSNGQS